MQPFDVLAELVQHTPDGGTVMMPRALAAALVESFPAASGADQGGTGPGGDFTAADLRRRFRRSASWVRERFASGDFGVPYQLGKDRIALREEVLAFEDRLRRGRGSTEPSHRPNPAPRGSGKALRAANGGSLAARRNMGRR